MLKYQIQIISKLIIILGYVNLCSNSWTHGLRLLSIGFTEKGKTKSRRWSILGKKPWRLMICLFLSETKSINQQHKILEHSRGTPGSLVYIVLVSNTFCFDVTFGSILYSILAIKDNYILILEPVNASLYDKRNFKCVIKLRILRWGDSLAYPGQTKL